jgi:hypothetical protein
MCNYKTLIEHGNSINSILIVTICVMYGRVALFRPKGRQPDQAVDHRRVGLRGCADVILKCILVPISTHRWKHCAAVKSANENKTRVDF